VRHVRLGRTGLPVSRLCLGTMTFGLQCDEPASRAILDRAAEGGITFLDTADVYPIGGTPETVGRTEEILGRWLTGRRHEFIVATKCSGATGGRSWDRGLSRKHVLDAIDASLRRLRTDYVDLYQARHPDPETPIEETLRAFDDIVRAGKARYVGCSNYPAWQTARPGPQRRAGPRPLRDRAATLQPSLQADRARVAAAVRGRRSRGDSLQPAGRGGFSPGSIGARRGRRPARASRSAPPPRRYQERYWREREFDELCRLRGHLGHFRTDDLRFFQKAA
jgi:1-deoxyxylulose-5-phosphate synthase